jgi:hypothetical protein
MAHGPFAMRREAHLAGAVVQEINAGYEARPRRTRIGRRPVFSFLFNTGYASAG